MPSPTTTPAGAWAQSATSSQAMPFARIFEILEVELHVATDDAGLLQEFASVFGGHPATDRPRRTAFRVTLAANDPTENWGRLSVQGDALGDPAGFLLGFASPTIPLRSLPSPTGDPTTLVGLEGDDHPLLAFRDDECLFRKVPRWRRIVSHFLFLRLLRLRADLLFFHAASVGIAGSGVLFVGPKGAGKSTVSGALAARGHNFLGDETAAYQPKTGLLLPFRRPLGIKPGPRAALVDRSLADLARAGDEDGLVRVPVEALFPVPEAIPVPLRALCFLDGFAARPELLSTCGGREELARMQPLASSLGPGTTSCVFEMIRLLGATACYRLHPGDPDETAALLEEAFTRS